MPQAYLLGRVCTTSTSEVPLRQIEQIELEFNKSKIPYVVKITNRADIEDYFYDLIKDSLVKIL